MIKSHNPLKWRTFALTSILTCSGVIGGRAGDDIATASKFSVPAGWSVVASRVVDRTTGLPLVGATVTLGGIEAAEPTAANGMFAIEVPSATPQQMLTVSAPGYLPFSTLLDTAKASALTRYGKTGPTIAVTPLPAPVVGEVFAPQNQSRWMAGSGGAHIPVQGYTSLAKKNPFKVEVIFVIDTSGSTGRGTAYDLNRDGVPDTVLDVELYACDRLLNRLKAKHVRCGIVKFARYHARNAPDGGQSDGPVVGRQTRVVQGLTGDDGLIAAALNTVAAEGAEGGTHTAAGIDLALEAFLAGAGSSKGGNDTPARHIVLLTDGIPTLPVEPGETQQEGDRLATIAAAQRALAANVQIHPVVIDSVDAERRLTTMPSVQAISGVPGGLVRVGLRDLHNLPHQLDDMTFAGIEKVLVRDLTIGASWVVETTPDGWFDAEIPATLGVNRWEFRFAANDAKNALVRTVTFEVAPFARAAQPVAE